MSQTDPVLTHVLLPLQEYLSTPDLIELSVVREQEVLLEMLDKGYQCLAAPELTSAYWTRFCYILSNHDGVGFDLIAQPRVSTRLPDGHRFEAMLGSSVASGISVSIRMNRNIEVKISDFGLPSNLEAELISSVQEGQSIIISGGTSSGKTTLLKALIQHIPLSKRILTVEDTRELDLLHTNKVHYLVSRNEAKTSVTWDKVTDHILRSRPDVIIAGELSIANTASVINLIDTGHKGFMTTVHSNSSKMALTQTIPRKASIMNKQVNPESICELLQDSIDCVLQIAKVGGKRQITEIWQPQKQQHFKLTKE